MRSKKLDFEQFAAAFTEAYTTYTGNTLTDYDNWVGFRDMCRFAWRSLDKRTKPQRKWRYFTPTDIRADERAKENERIRSLSWIRRLLNRLD